jgi:hypothetical protein
MAVRGADPGSRAVSKTYRAEQFLKACLETARDWSHFLKLPHWIPKCSVLLFLGIAFVIAARAATIPKQFRLLEDDDASGVVRHISPISAPVASRQRQKHVTVRASKSETSVAGSSKRNGYSSEEKSAKAGEEKLSPKQSSSARNGVSHDQIRK